MEPPSRKALRSARRVLIKAGTSIVANKDGRPSLTRLGAIVEQISELRRNGIQVIFVSSGAVGMGKRMLRTQNRLNMSFLDLQKEQDETTTTMTMTTEGGGNVGNSGGLSGDGNMIRTTSFASFVDRDEAPRAKNGGKNKIYDSACAAAGQFEMMNLYSSLFNQYDLTASQLLLTQADFQDSSHLQNLNYVVNRLLNLGIVPIVNENDAVSGNSGYTPQDVFSDNDSLAALCARSFQAEVCVLLTDVEGVFDRPPSEKGSRLLDFFGEDSSAMIGEKSDQGRGGMAAKIEAAKAAVAPGSTCGACVIALGADLNSIRSILSPDFEYKSPKDTKGTLFVTPGSDLEALALKEMALKEASTINISEQAKTMANSSRTQARILQNLPYATRQKILYTVAEALESNESKLLEANAIDLQNAQSDNIDHQLIKRLKLTTEKIQTLSNGIKQIADLEQDPLYVVQSHRELAPNLELQLVSVPIGVLLIIFESRPDSLPQISALALASGNGLLLKGGKEAKYSNEALHKVIGDAIEEGSGGLVTRDIIGLVTTRGQVKDLLSLDDVIDLVIPRGSNSLVSYIKANTKIPVLGHADGVCHVYVDESVSIASDNDNNDDICQIIVDAKTDYPSACNAMETLLLHSKTLENGGIAMSILMKLRAAGVKCFGGPKAMNVGLCDVPAPKLKYEYGDLQCLVEVVDSLDEAVDWIHKYGSGHTETIICSEGNPVGEEFLKKVDAACVFVNASTRFADGYRFGLGAEVGISTGRIHARGPVGVEGLLTTKWQLRSKKGIHYVGEFSGDNPKKVYTHKDLM